MIQRNPLKRAPFEKLLEFVTHHKLFEGCRNRVIEVEKPATDNHMNFVITAISDIQLQQIERLYGAEPEVKQEPEVAVEMETPELAQVERYILSTRVVVCFLNRLARRLELLAVRL